MLATWLGRPHVERWWREPSDPVSVAERYRPMVDGTDPTEGFVVALDGRSIGFAQRYRIEDDPVWHQAIVTALGDGAGVGIDYLIGDPGLVGRGVGRRMIADFTALTWSRYPDAWRIVVAVQHGNTPSRRALEAAGFQLVWGGTLETGDPSDLGVSDVYVLIRPGT